MSSVGASKKLGCDPGLITVKGIAKTWSIIIDTGASSSYVGWLSLMEFNNRPMTAKRRLYRGPSSNKNARHYP